MKLTIYNKVQGWVKWLLPLYLITFLPLLSSAQQIKGKAPSQVAVGEQFRLSYTVNTDDVSGFRAGNIPDAFEVLMGPSTSTQSSFPDGQRTYVQFDIRNLYLYSLCDEEWFVYHSFSPCHHKW